MRTTTTADGRFEFDFPLVISESRPLAVACAGYAPRVVERQPDSELDVRMEPAQRIVGRVVDPGNEPLAGWRIHRLGGLIVDRDRGAFAEDLLSEEVASCVRSDAEGRFALEGLAPTRYRLLACDSATLACAEVVVDADAPLPVTIVADPLNGALGWEGTVLDLKGEPVPGVDVIAALVLWEGGSALHSTFDTGRSGRTDERGHVRLERLPSGDRVRLLVTGGGLVPRMLRPNEWRASTAIRCERLVRFRFVGTREGDPSRQRIAISAEDEGGEALSVYSVDPWIEAAMLPAAMFTSAGGVSERARALLVHDARRGVVIERIEALDVDELVEIDLGAIAAESSR